MPLAGYLATRGDMNILVVTGAGTVGSLAGTLPWYYLGKKLGHDGVRRLASEHGRWLTMKPSDVDAASERFKRHGKKLGSAGTSYTDGANPDFRAGRCC